MCVFAGTPQSPSTVCLRGIVRKDAKRKLTPCFNYSRYVNRDMQGISDGTCTYLFDVVCCVVLFMCRELL